MKQRRLWTAIAFVGLTVASLATGCANVTGNETDAETFAAQMETELHAGWIEAERSAWVYSNFITDDTEKISSDARRRSIESTVRLAAEATRFDGSKMSDETARKLRMLKTSMTMVAPQDAALTAELTEITAGMEGRYGKGTYCSEQRNGECLDLGAMGNILAESRDPEEMLDLWTGWRTVSPPMRTNYQRFVELVNAGSQDLGFSDMGDLWRSNYDMEADAFSVEVDRLWDQVRPLYEQLHCHVRAQLNAAYGDEVVPLDRPIPAHLLGNMWAQSWGNIYDLVAPPSSDPGFDLTEILNSRKIDEREMVRYGERFFTSLGFEPLPDTFWERSLFVKPQDRDVVCHASAWNVDAVDDLRIKMCINVNAEDFVTIHHELGHNFYQRAYNHQSPLHQNSANDGFHEGIGDTIALSITPEYLVQVGLLDSLPADGGDLGLLMRSALDKVAFLPFGLVVDQWRWQVFGGEIPTDAYNEGWWKLRQQYQGIEAPVARSEADFDPGAKYHVPGNTPYTRYFLAHILQYQFHRSLCELAGFEGDLHRCSIYNNEKAGAALGEMLAMGASKPWPDALEALTGQREMDATAIVDYYAPLMSWLEEQNADRSCGW